jgi:hypothetical protein
MALAVVVLTGMLALSVDVGSSFVQRRSLQTAADAGVMAGAHLALEDVINGVAASSARYDLQRNTVINFVKLNGAAAADTILVQWVDGSGNPFPNDGFNRPVVGAGTVQGMKVSVTGNRKTLLFNTLGISTVGVNVNAMAQFGTPNGLVGPVPLVLNWDTVPRDPVTGKPTLYQAVLMQPSTGVISGSQADCCRAGQIDNAGKPIPSDFYAPATPLGPSNFFILHDKPTDLSPLALANENSTHYGLTTTIQLSTFYYAEHEKATTNNFALGLLDRVNDANSHPIFGGDTPTAGGFHPTNPRLFIVGINPLATDTPCSPPCDPSLVTSLQITEFLAFYVQFVVFDPAVPANGMTIGGYYVLSTGVPGNNGFGNPAANGPKIFRITQ